MKNVKNELHDGCEVFSDQAKKERDNDHYYLKCAVGNLLSFFVGCVLAAFLNSYGFGAAFFGFLLTAAGFFLAKCINRENQM